MAEPKRYIHHVQRWEDLLGLPEPYESFPAEATAERTLNVYVPVEVLAAIVGESLASIAANREAVDTTPELTAETDALVAQREAFLRLLRACPNRYVYMAMYPAAEWAPAGEEDGDDPERD